MNRKYDGQMEDLQRRQEHRDAKALRTAIQSEVSSILSGEIESEAFCKTILESLTVFKDRHMELRLNGLPHVFRFAG